MTVREYLSKQKATDEFGGVLDYELDFEVVAQLIEGYLKLFHLEEKAACDYCGQMNIAAQLFCDKCKRHQINYHRAPQR